MEKQGEATSPWKNPQGEKSKSGGHHTNPGRFLDKLDKNGKIGARIRRNKRGKASFAKLQNKRKTSVKKERRKLFPVPHLHQAIRHF